MRTLARNALRTCISPQQIYGVVRYPENSYFGIFSRQPIGSPYGSLCIRGLRRIRSPPVGVTNHSSPPVGVTNHSSCLRRDVQESFLQCAGGPEGRLASKATEMSEPCSAQRRPAPPSAARRADPTRSLCFRVLDSTGSYKACPGMNDKITCDGSFSWTCLA